MNHNTLDSNTKMYIDNIEFLELHDNTNTYKISGWLHSSNGEMISIYFGDDKNQKIEHISNKRPDVKKVYPSLLHDNVGFTFLASREQISKPMFIVLENGIFIKIAENLLEWAAMYTKFNRVHKDLIVVDNFYNDPDIIREYAINNMNYANSDYHKGKRTQDRFIVNETKERFEKIIGRRITNWNHPNYANGVFQFTTAQDPIVYHVDTQTYAAMVFLTPNAPIETGTAFYKSKFTGATIFDGTHDQEEFNKTFKGLNANLNFYDSTQYELMDEVANVYNRLVLFNAKRIHAATKYFGDEISNARFFQLFFFDVE